MKKALTLMLSSALMLSLTGCAGMNNQDVGVLTGGAIGGAVGSLFGEGSGRILATAGGAVLGAFLGGSIGHNMDETDRLKMSQAIQNNHPNQVSHWKNPNNGNEYAVTTSRVYHRQTQRGDEPCKNFTTKAIIGGKTQTIYGKACRMADGTWKVVQE